MAGKITYELVFKGSNLSLYNYSNHILYADFHGYINLESSVESLQALVRFMEELQSYMIIVDDTRIRGTYIPWISYIEKEILPVLIELGMNKIAHIYSTDQAAVESLNKFLETPRLFESQAFHSFEEATKWLTGAVMSPPYEMHNYTFRTSRGMR